MGLELDRFNRRGCRARTISWVATTRSPSRTRACHEGKGIYLDGMLEDRHKIDEVHGYFMGTCEDRLSKDEGPVKEGEEGG